MARPITLDGINYTLLGCLVYSLRDDDTILGTDFIRELIETGEDGGFDTTFKSPDWRGVAWHRVASDFTGWIGKTYNDFIAFSEKNERTHEIIRVLPESLRFELMINGTLPNACRPN